MERWPSSAAGQQRPAVRVRLVELVGRATDTDAVGAALTNATPVPLRPGGGAGPRRDQMPLYLDVVTLRPAGS